MTMSRSTRVALGAAYVVVILIAGAIYVRILPSSDQSIFDYLAWLNANGVPYYQGSFDMTWPGQLVFHELYLRLFGVHVWTARAGDLLLLQPAIVAMYVYLRRAGFPKAAAAAALLYPIIYVTSGPWMAGHRDIVGVHFLIGASIFALPSERRSWWWPTIAGLLAGYAVMIRPTYLAFAPILFLIGLPTWKGGDNSAANFFKQALLFAVGLAIPPLGFAIYGMTTGTLHDWYIDAVRFVFDVYPVTQGRGRLLGMATHFLVTALWWLVLAGGLGALLWLMFDRRREGLWLLVAMMATVLLSYLVQNKGFGYHLAGLIPALVLLACAGIEGALRAPFRASIARNAVAAIVGFFMILGVGSRLAHARPVAPDFGRQEQDKSLKLDDTLAFVDIIRSESASTDTAMDWGREYQVAFLSERRSPTKFFNVDAERLIRPGQPFFGDWLLHLASDLSDRPPKFILVDGSIIPPGTGLPATGSADAPIDQIIKRRLDYGYVIREQRGNFTLLKRIGDGK
jgi:hypothetical protein